MAEASETGGAVSQPRHIIVRELCEGRKAAWKPQLTPSQSEHPGGKKHKVSRRNKRGTKGAQRGNKERWGGEDEESRLRQPEFCHFAAPGQIMSRIATIEALAYAKCHPPYLASPHPPITITLVYQSSEPSALLAHQSELLHPAFSQKPQTSDAIQLTTFPRNAASLVVVWAVLKRLLSSHVNLFSPTR
jgi:hypothetical protein